MLQFIRNKLFGEARPRTNSLQGKSKGKENRSDKRLHSIDSKQKEKKQAELAESKKKNSPEEISEFDEIVTVKKPLKTLSRNNMKVEKMDLDFVSDIAQEDEQDDDNLGSYPSLMVEVNNEINKIERMVSPIKSKPDSTNIFESPLYTAYLLELAKDTVNHNQSEVIPQQQKVRIKRQPSTKLVRRIHEECSVCHRPLKISDSYQLACTHRYHRACTLKMQWNNRYKCDLCEIGNNKKGSIILMNKRSQRLSND